MSVSYGGDSITFADGSVQSGAWNGFRNRIINGTMVIDQRNAGASVTATTASLYSVDRWQTLATVSSKFTAQQNAASVTPPAGFVNYLGITSSAATTVGATDYYILQQSIEGYNLADLNWGSANAQTITLSFWVRSSLTGSFGVVLQNGSNNRSYPILYTISSANTWEQKSITIAGDTSGTWYTTNGNGVQIRFDLGIGSTYRGTSGAWTGTSNIYGVTGATSVVGTNGATFYITGVQLERGSTASSFEYRPIGTELALCQRYYEKSYNIGTVAGTSTNTAKGSLSVGAAFSQYLRWTQNYRVSKRADATFTIYSTTGASGNVRLNNASDLAVTIEDSGENASAIYVNRSWTLGDFVWWQWTASAEL